MSDDAGFGQGFEETGFDVAGFDDEFAELLAAISEVRAALEGMEPGSLGERVTRADLVQGLQQLAAWVVGMPEEAGRRDDVPDPEEVVREARTTLDLLLATAPAGSGEQRCLCLLAADQLELESLFDEGAAVEDEVIRFLDLAHDPGPDAGDDAEAEYWWTDGDTLDARKRLAFCLFDRSMAEERDEDRDRVIDLLTPLVDADDERADAYVRACLGLALARRHNDEAATDLRRRGDRRKAIALLRAAFEADEDDAEIREMTVLELARMRWCDHDCAAPDPARDGLGGIIGLLAPFTEDPDALGADATAMCAMIAHDLHEHEADPAHEASKITWFRRAARHSALPEETRRDFNADLGVALAERAMRTTTQPTPGDPEPADDRREAVEHFGLALAMLEAADDSETPPGGDDLGEQREALRWLMFDTLSRDDQLSMPAETLDRLIALGETVVAAIDAEDSSLRGETCLKLGLAHHSRMIRAVMPGLGLFTGLFLTNDLSPTPLGVTLPAATDDLDRAIDLLRTGLGLHDYDHELYATVSGVLGLNLLFRFLTRLPATDRPVLDECLRRLRRSYDHWRRQLADAKSLREIRGTFMHALTWSVWSNPPLVMGREKMLRGEANDTSVSGFPGAENDEQLLGQLLDDALADPEEDARIIVLAVAVFHRRDGDLPDDATCRTWIQRLETLLRTESDLSAFDRGVLHLNIGLIGLTLGERGSADPAMVRRALDAVRDAQTYFPAGHPVREKLDQALEAGPSMFARHTSELVSLMLGVPPTASPARPDAPSAAPPPGDAADAPAQDPIDLSAAALIGDGLPYPFTEPPLRVLEIVDEAVPDLAGDPARRPAAAAITAMVRHDRGRRERDGQDLTEAIGLMRAAAAGCAPEGALRDRLEASLAGMLLDRYHLAGDRADLDLAAAMFAALIERIDPEAERQDPDAPPAEWVTIVTFYPDLVPMLVQRATEDGLPAVAELVKDAPTSRDFLAELLAAAGSAALLVAELDGTPDDRAARLLGRAAEALPDDHPRLPGARSEAAWIKVLRAREIGDDDAEHAAAEEVLAAATDCPPDHPHLPALLLRATAVVELEEEPGAAWTDQLVRRLEAAAERPVLAHHSEVARCRYALGHLLVSRHLRTGDPGDLDQAIATLESARLTFSTSPGDPFAVVLLRTLAHAYRVGAPDSGDRRRKARETGRSVLSAHGHAVLLQSGTHRGLGAARRADVDMLRLVRWCLADGRLTEALDALELGRGLVLQAATVAATVPDMLRESGHGDLADAWTRFTAPSGPADSAAPGDRAAGATTAIPEDVRRRTLEALTGTVAERRIMSAPRPAEVGHALRAVRADALVYLIPGTARDGGHALVVRSEGTVEHRPLAGLVRTRTDALERYLRALDRQAHEASRPAVPERDMIIRTGRRSHLDRLCAWAGPAATAELLDHARSWGLGRPARLVLAPIGTLGVVPWHAARLDGPTDPQSSDDGRGPARFACQEAVFSYCATSRQLVDAAHRSRLPLDGVRVLVVDPHGSDVMHEEAARIRQDFYPDSTLIGTYATADRDGTPAPEGPAAPLPAVASSVDPFLPGRGATSAAVFVANCHAFTGAVAADSRLVLDGEDPDDPDRVVTVDRLMSGAAVRDPAAPGGLFLLANCGSDLSLADRDEAMTITTAVLAAGAATVVGTRWAVVDDVRTMVLMYMIHHHLAAGFAPADALCAAQLWMLDPGRIPPPGIADLMAGAVGERWDDPRIWAAFTHHGH